MPYLSKPNNEATVNHLDTLKYDLIHKMQNYEKLLSSRGAADRVTVKIKTQVEGLCKNILDAAEQGVPDVREKGDPAPEWLKDLENMAFMEKILGIKGMIDDATKKQYQKVMDSIQPKAATPRSESQKALDVEAPKPEPGMAHERSDDQKMQDILQTLYALKGELSEFAKRSPDSMQGTRDELYMIKDAIDQAIIYIRNNPKNDKGIAGELLKLTTLMENSAKKDCIKKNEPAKELLCRIVQSIKETLNEWFPHIKLFQSGPTKILNALKEQLKPKSTSSKRGEPEGPKPKPDK